MESFKKYWQIIIMVIGIVSTATAAQVQIGVNSNNIEDLKLSLINLDDQKTKQAVMQLSLQHMKEDLDEIKQLIREMKR